MSRRPEVCRDFLRGSCRFGARCRYLHHQQPPQQQYQQQQQRGYSNFAFNQPQQRSNYFGPLAGSSHQGQRQNQVVAKDHKCIDVRLCKEQIRDDFAYERPSFWRLTSYGHWKYLPNDVTGDVSFEELRAHFYEGSKQGMSFQQLAQREASLFSAKNSELESLLKDYRGPAPAVDSGSFPFPTPTPAASTSASPFINPSAAASPFLAPPTNSQMVFGTPVPQSASVFGQPQGFRQVAASFGPSAAQQPLGGFMSSFGMQSSIGVQNSTGIFQGSNPFANVGRVSSPSNNQPFFASSPSNHTPASSPVGNVFASVSPFPSSFNFSGATASPLSVAPTATPIQNDFAFLTSPQAPAPGSLAATGPAAEGKPQASDDRWLASKWSIGEIPEEEPPIHVRH